MDREEKVKGDEVEEEMGQETSYLDPMRRCSRVPAADCRAVPRPSPK